MAQNQHFQPEQQLPVQVVGVGAAGWESLDDESRGRVLAADVVLGGARHLAMLPPVPGQRREPWPAPLREQLPALLDELRGKDVVVLASGDPMVSGIGSTLVELLGAERVDVVPAVSSVALARARMGWAAEGCAVVSVVGRPVQLVARELAPGRRILVLNSDEGTPAALAELLCAQGFGASRLTLLGNLGADDESRTTVLAAELAQHPDHRGAFPRLAITAVEVDGAGGWGWTAGLPDEAFEHDGQITKRDVRASALSRLAPRPGEHLWDVGAGAGSVGIEWMRAHPSCRTTAVEANPERADRIRRNAARLGVPGIDVVQGHSPEALVGLPRPDAVFVGGGASIHGVIDDCLAALDGRGRIVVHAVTLETEQAVAAAYRQHGGELARLAVETSAPIGSFTGWAPARTITQWTLDLSANPVPPG